MASWRKPQRSLAIYIIRSNTKHILHNTRRELGKRKFGRDLVILSMGVLLGAFRKVVSTSGGFTRSSMSELRRERTNTIYNPFSSSSAPNSTALAVLRMQKTYPHLKEQISESSNARILQVMCLNRIMAATADCRLQKQKFTHWGRKLLDIQVCMISSTEDQL